MRYEVPGMTLIPQQKDMSCWYASAQMLVQWKMDSEQACLVNLIPPEFDESCRKIRDADTGIQNPEIIEMANRIGLRAVPPMSPTPDAIMSWLKVYGPLWVNGKTHIVVIAGIDGLNVKVYDPAPVGFGNVDWRTLDGWYVGSTVSSRDTGKDVETVLLYCP